MRRLSISFRKRTSLNCTPMERLKIDFKRVDTTEESRKFYVRLIDAELMMYDDIENLPHRTVNITRFVMSPSKLAENTILLKRRDMKGATGSDFHLLLMHFPPNCYQEWTTKLNTFYRRSNAAIIIQRTARARTFRERAADLVECIKDSSARTIQKSWRSSTIRNRWKSLVPLALASRRNPTSRYSVPPRTLLAEVNFKELPDDETQIMYDTKDKKEKRRRKVLSATLPKLVDVIMRTDDTGLIQTVITTLPNFAEPYSLMHLILRWLKEADHTSVDGLIRVLSIWVELAPEDFDTPHIRSKLDELLIFVRMAFGKEKANTITSLTQPQYFRSRSLSPKLLRHANKIRLFIELEPLEAARQFTLSSFGLIQEMKVRELNKLAWQKDPNRAPTVRVTVDRSNKMSRWVASSILDADPVKGLQIFEWWIATAQFCLGLGNYSDLVAISIGLQHHCVSRLKTRIAALSPESQKTMTTLEEVCSMARNHKNLRELVKKRTAPYVPFLGISLKDLVFIEENPTLVEGRICLEKMEMINSVITNVKRAATINYDLTPVPAWQALLWPPSGHDDAELYRMSLVIEPKTSSTSSSSYPTNPVPSSATLSPPSPSRARSKSIDRRSGTATLRHSTPKMSVEHLFKAEQMSVPVVLFRPEYISGLKMRPSMRESPSNARGQCNRSGRAEVLYLIENEPESFSVIVFMRPPCASSVGFLYDPSQFGGLLELGFSSNGYPFVVYLIMWLLAAVSVGLWLSSPLPRSSTPYGAKEDAEERPQHCTGTSRDAEFEGVARMCYVGQLRRDRKWASHFHWIFPTSWFSTLGSVNGCVAGVSWTRWKAGWGDRG
ncbi:hypothetical protein PROFUN_01117 [Planoprotostelium fungivorum]|uniref:Ras-GEF domain-containing protein n=1 Tax=Planoprotostelium fungivorum TaxID=1890364 RepID=A0A2P6NCD5_9EUKA|nr:hypothetical protein PROFUN_01117 [Planoprotostelium fungivorum]